MPDRYYYRGPGSKVDQRWGVYHQPVEGEPVLLSMHPDPATAADTVARLQADEELKARLFTIARSLTAAEDADDNPEYTRGQVEMICDLLGIPGADVEAVHNEIWPVLPERIELPYRISATVIVNTKTKTVEKVTYSPESIESEPDWAVMDLTYPGGPAEIHDRAVIDAAQAIADDDNGTWPPMEAG